VKLADLLQNRQLLFRILNFGGWAGYTIAAWLGAPAH
jgi:hypothetical protein